MSLRKILETFIRFFPSYFNRKYVPTVACTVVFVGLAHFVFNAYSGRNATCPLSSCSNKNDGPRGRFSCISTVSCKESLCVEVLTSFYGRFFVEEGQFIKYTPSTSSLHLGSRFSHFLTPPRFRALNLPKVNQFTGNCYRMVRIVLKITFLKLRYGIPKAWLGDSLSVLLWLLSVVILTLICTGCFKSSFRFLVRLNFTNYYKKPFVKVSMLFIIHSTLNN